MKTSGKPSNFTISRTSTQNSVLTNYTFSIVPSLYYETGDIIKLVAPTPIVFANTSKCIGLTALSSDLTCTKSSDNTTISLKISTTTTKLLRNLAVISSGTTV